MYLTLCNVRKRKTNGNTNNIKYNKMNKRKYVYIRNVFQQKWRQL